MNVAIIGTGFIANTHAEELIHMGIRPALAVGRNQAHTEAFAEKWQIPASSVDFNKALSDEIDVVHVCTPPTLHYEMVSRLLAAGKHVICEKPLCLTAAEAKALYDAAKEKGVVTAVNFNVRYHEMCRVFRQRVADGETGLILFIHGSYEQEFHVLPAEYSWRYQESLAGKMRATTEIGSHWIDLARFLSGLEITEVSAAYGAFFPDRIVRDGMMYPVEVGKDGGTSVSSGRKDISSGSPVFASEESDRSDPYIRVDTDDIVSTTMRLSNGGLVNLFLSEITHGRSNRVGIEITGTKKTLRWNSETPYQLESAEKFAGTLRETNAFCGGFPDTFTAFFHEVYRDIEEGRPSPAPSYPTFLDGYRNAAVCEAIFESATHNSAWTEVSR